MPHSNNPLHRQAVMGIEFLSVVTYTSNSSNIFEKPDVEPGGPPVLQEPIPLPSDDIQEVSGTVGSLRILDGRVDVEYGLYEYGSERDEVVHITLDITLDQEDDLQQNMYVGFGFAADTMSGLVITCSPILVRAEDLEGGSVMQELTPRCHQWHGSGTNLYPRPPPDTDRG